MAQHGVFFRRNHAIINDIEGAYLINPYVFTSSTTGHFAAVASIRAPIIRVDRVLSGQSSRDDLRHLFGYWMFATNQITFTPMYQVDLQEITEKLGVPVREICR